MRKFLMSSVAILLCTWVRAGQELDHARLGREAMRNGIWEVASEHFRQSLLVPGLPADSIVETSLLLAESSLRSGDFEAAIEILGEPHLEDHPETPYWKAQALTQQGRFHNALELLDSQIHKTESKYRAESAITASNLRLLLGQTESALSCLESIAIDPANPITIHAHLRKTSILIDLGRTQDARAAFPDLSGMPPIARRKLSIPSTLVEGRLLLAEGSPKKAASKFQTILINRSGCTSRQHEMAALGMGDSLVAQAKLPEASSFLLEYIQAHPESEQLTSLFDRLLPLLPAPTAQDDPLWQPIIDWAGTAPIPATGFIATLGLDSLGALPIQTTQPQHPELLAHALYALRHGWSRSPLPQASQSARHYTNRLRTEAPNHPRTSKILLEIAKSDLDQGNFRSALGLLDAIRSGNAELDLQGEALFLEAITMWKQGDPAGAEQAFQQAAANLPTTPARHALFNAGLIRMIRNELEPDSLNEPPDITDPELAADLMLEKALATSDRKRQLEQLERFLGKYPDHPRAANARIAAANAALMIDPPDLSLASAQIATIQAMPEKSRPPEDQIALTEIRILDRSGNSNAVIDATTRFVREKPGSTEAAEIMFLLGRNLYQTEKYNDARLVLERLASLDEDPNKSQACWLLAARSANMVATQQSKQEALILFDKAIGLDGPLSVVSRLEKARLLIDLNRPQDAESLLAEWFHKMEEDAPSFLPSGFLLAESIRAQGTPEALEKSMEIYDKLLTRAQDQPEAYYRLQYLRGLTFEQMGDPETGVGKRIREAFVAYYSVLENDHPPTEWHYFELCGFKALSMLLDAGRWPAAIACARRIAAFHGPRAKDAEEIASQLQLKHQIWED